MLIRMSFFYEVSYCDFCAAEKFSADVKRISVSVHRQILQNYGVTADDSAHR